MTGRMTVMGLKAVLAGVARSGHEDDVGRVGGSGDGLSTPPPTPAGSTGATEYVITAGRKVVVAPAPGRPLPTGGGLPGRLERDHPGSHRRLRQRRSRPGCAPASADRQRHRPGPQPKRVYRTPGGARALPGGRAHHFQALPPHHPGQERALRSDPVPLPGPAAPGRLHHRASGLTHDA